jgi:hypothetical protein
LCSKWTCGLTINESFETGFDRYGINTERNGFMLYDGEKIPALSFEY